MHQILRALLTPFVLVFGWFSGYGLRLILWWTKPSAIHGIPTVSLASEQGKEMDQMRAALELIGKVDAPRLERMQREFSAIMIRPLGSSRGRLYHNPLICHIDLDYARNASVSELALTLVHEAEHAASHHHIRYTEGESRLAAERQCLEVELAFVARLPSSPGLVRAIQARLKSLPHAYSDAALEQSLNATLRLNGAPEWLIRLTDQASRSDGRSDGAA